MSRDLLLMLIALAVLLNVGLLLGVAYARLRPTRRSVVRSGRGSHGRVTRASPGVAPAGRASAAAIMVAGEAPDPDAGSGRSFAPAPVGAGASAAAPPVVARRPPSPPVGDAPPPPLAAVPPVVRRARRFVLPKLEEDRVRAERAIQAVLGEGSSDRGIDGGAHRPRRRARRHRVPGPVEHTAVDLTIAGLEDLRSLAGIDIATRLRAAVASTVHAHVRSGDRTIDLGDGRFRLIVEADAAGATSSAERLRSLTAVWLDAALVPLTLRTSVVATGSAADPAAVPAKPAEEGAAAS